MDNCVVMEWGDAERHVRECLIGELINEEGGERRRRRPEEVWGEEVRRVVERRGEEMRRDREAVM